MVARLLFTTPCVIWLDAPADTMPPLIVVAPLYVLPVPKVSAETPEPVAAAESVTVVGVREIMVVPGAMPAPLTACPTARPAVLATVTDALPFKVPFALDKPPDN